MVRGATDPCRGIRLCLSQSRSAGRAGNELFTRLTFLALKVFNNPLQVVVERRGVRFAMPMNLLDNVVFIHRHATIPRFSTNGFLGLGIIGTDSKSFHHFIERNTHFTGVFLLGLLEQQQIFRVFQQFLYPYKLVIRKHDEFVLTVLFQKLGVKLNHKHLPAVRLASMQYAMNNDVLIFNLK
jgi:hypothetical protein